MNTQVFIANVEGPGDVRVVIQNADASPFGIRILKPRECMSEYIGDGQELHVEDAPAVVEEVIEDPVAPEPALITPEDLAVETAEDLAAEEVIAEVVEDPTL